MSEDYKQLLKELNEAKSNTRCISDRVFNYIQLLFKRLNIGDKTQEWVLENYKNLRADGFFGMDGNPRTASGSLVYIGGVLNKEYVRKRDIFDTLDMKASSESTNKIYKKILAQLNIDYSKFREESSNSYTSYTSKNHVGKLKYCLICKKIFRPQNSKFLFEHLQLEHNKGKYLKNWIEDDSDFWNRSYEEKERAEAQRDYVKKHSKLLSIHYDATEFKIGDTNGGYYLINRQTGIKSKITALKCVNKVFVSK